MGNQSHARPHNQNALTHGGEASIKRLASGQPFLGVALAAYEGVLAEMGVALDTLSGIEGVLVKRAARFEATARLFDAAAAGAAEAGDLDRWERYQQRMGWIGNRAFGALSEVRKLLAQRDVHTLEVLLSQEVEDGQDAGQ